MSKIRSWTVEILALHVSSLCACKHMPNVIPTYVLVAELWILKKCDTHGGVNRVAFVTKKKPLRHVLPLRDKLLKRIGLEWVGKYWIGKHWIGKDWIGNH